MKKEHISAASKLALLCLAGMLALSSCAGFKLVSQRPVGGASVDANSSATAPAEAPAQGSGNADQKPKGENPDAVSAATS